MSILNFIAKIFSLSSGPSKVSAEMTTRIKSEWATIDILSKGRSPSQLRQALISADKTVDNALRDLVYGETMGERLKNARTLFEATTYDKLWKAHKLRNNLVHESGFEPSYVVLESAVSDIRSALFQIGVFV